MKSLWLILTACVCVIGHTDAQGGYIQGVALEFAGGGPVPYAQIATPDKKHFTISDDRGRFIIGPLAAGVHQLLLSRIGYAVTASDSIVVLPGDTVRANVFLSVESLLAQEVLVTAARKTQDIHLAPASASVITERDFSLRTITTFDQALDYASGVTISRSGGANVQSLSIRGASETAGGGTGNRVLLLIDGRPAMSPESGGALWTLVPLNSLRRIEVVKGAYSALFGSAAMGGVINAITHEPPEDGNLKVGARYGFYDKAPAYTGYDRYRDFYTLDFSYAKKSGKWSYLLDASRKANDGHREKSGFGLYNSYAKLKYAFAPNRSLQLSANFNRLSNDTPATWLSSRMAYTVAAHRKDDFQNKQEFSSDLHYSAISGSHTKYSSRFYYYNNYSEFLFNDDPGNDSTNVNAGKQFIDRETIRAGRLGNITQIDISLFTDHYFIIGFDIKFDRTSALPDTVLYGKHDAFQSGFFLQDEWDISDRLKATIGARFDHYAILDGHTENNFSPKVAIVYALSKRVSIRGLFARAFRNPAIAERYIKFEQGGGLRFEPNPDLRAEKLTVSAEVGTNMRLAEGVVLDASLFYNHYQDLISFNQLSAPGEPLLFQVVNLKKALMRGAEFSLSCQLSRNLLLRAEYTYLDARDASENRVNDELAYKAKHSASFIANALVGKWDLAVSARGRSAIEEVFIYPGSEPGGYLLLNAKCTFSPVEAMHYYLAINNIGDVQYEELERYRMPGRSYTLGFQFEF